MAWITGNGSSVGPGIMRTGRVWHWAQLMLTSNAPVVAGTVRSAHTEGGLRSKRPGSARPTETLVVKSALLSGHRPAPDQSPAPAGPAIGFLGQRLRFSTSGRLPRRAQF